MKWEDYENISKQVKELQKEQKVSEKREPPTDIHGDCQYIWAPEKGMATVCYICAMIFGTIFNARILIWIVATLIYFNFINNRK